MNFSPQVDIPTEYFHPQSHVQSLYRGFIPNALKNLPNKGIRLSVFDTSKKLLASSETAYEVS